MLELSGVDPAVTVGAWELEGWEVSVADHFYEPSNDWWSRYEFDVVIKRGLISGVPKALLLGPDMASIGWVSIHRRSWAPSFSTST